MDETIPETTEESQGVVPCSQVFLIKFPIVYSTGKNYEDSVKRHFQNEGRYCRVKEKKELHQIRALMHMTELVH